LEVSVEGGVDDNNSSIVSLSVPISDTFQAYTGLQVLTQGIFTNAFPVLSTYTP
jgi:hypothetical protein